ncbi:DXO-like protein [Mya arenaria]|uniref:Decapping nuclease n=1 Tax=Mya arenaria TaxID=6604 RepID=A0ABY7FI08_MYAAR|nr:DXO-like protein [Mya arenaria]
MARFNTDIGRFDYPNSGLNQPEELGCFSLDINREFHDDTSQRKYFIKPLNYDNVRFDLTKGYEGMVKRDEFKDEQIDHLLKWINNHEQGLAKIKQMMGEKDEEMCGWGCKFEQYLTANMRYNNCETFYTVVKATIGSHTLGTNSEIGGHRVFLLVFPRLFVGSVMMLVLLPSYKHTPLKIYQRWPVLVHLLEFSGGDATCTRLPRDSEYAFLH